MRVVHKFLVPFRGTREPVMAMPAPRDGRIVLVAADPNSGNPAVWIEYDPEKMNPEDARAMRAYATGAEIPVEAAHVGSLVAGAYVWHVYEEAWA